MEAIIPKSFEDFIKLVGVVGGLFTFIWSIWGWRQNRLKENENKRIEANKPFLELQLKVYLEATNAASRLCTSEVETEVKLAEKQFWELYHGQLALFETAEVAEAMRKLGDELLNDNNPDNLKLLAIDLAHCCRTSLARSWNAEIWTDYAD